MNFTLELTPTEKYYADFYEAWESQKWLRRWQSPLGIIMILFWAGLRYFDAGASLGIVPYCFMAFGLYEFAKPIYCKRKWMNERRDSKINGQKMTLHFTDEFIKVAGPFSHGEIKWAGIKEIKETGKGLFLVPENGISLFLPHAAFTSPEQATAIVQAQTLHR